MQLSTYNRMDVDNAVIAQTLLNTIKYGSKVSSSTGHFWNQSGQDAIQPSSWDHFEMSGIQEAAIDIFKQAINRCLVSGETRCTTSMTEVYVNMFKDNFQLNKYYSIENQGQVMSFLDEHEHLVDFLIEAASQIKSIFGQVSLKLRMRQDSELPEDHSLIGEIIMDLTVDDALSKLDEFDQRWFLDNARITGGKVQFDVEWC